ncbi:MAG: hypothetical protein DCC69_03600 [Hyphomicrobiales bacterium]|nr:MAG: hypothetical protein DCC69_03600 [Hyphomicrobiales bacterium]
MNVANLQIEGLVMALASLNNALVNKGILSADELDLALAKAEAAMTGEERLQEDLPPSNRDAVCFPIRLLRLANRSADETDICAFSELARMVGQTKHSYNDQM